MISSKESPCNGSPAKIVSIGGIESSSTSLIASADNPSWGFPLLRTFSGFICAASDTSASCILFVICISSSKGLPFEISSEGEGPNIFSATSNC